MIIDVDISPKALRETLCIAQARIGNSGLDEHRQASDIAHLQALINECDRHRPLGPDGKHGDRHTLTCGCDETGALWRAADRLAQAALGDPSIGMPPLHQDPTAKLLGLVDGDNAPYAAGCAGCGHPAGSHGDEGCNDQLEMAHSSRLCPCLLASWQVAPTTGSSSSAVDDA